jgi:hypothetical protein
MRQKNLLTSDLSRSGSGRARMLESAGMAALAPAVKQPFGAIRFELERVWAAGLFEGEGSFGIRRNGSVVLTLSSTDKDIIDRFRRVIGAGRISSQPAGRNGRRKRLWRVDLVQVDDVMRTILLLYPWLGARRQARADEAIETITRRIETATAERICPNCKLPFRPPFSPNAARTRFCSRLCERRFHWRLRWIRARERGEAA